MADDQLVGHAHAAVQLHRALADRPAGPRHRHLGRGHRLLALRGGAVDLRQRCADQRIGLQQRHVHVGESVLYDLEARDRHLELVALAHIVQRVAQQALHHADALGASGQQRFIADFGDQRQQVGPGLAQQSLDRGGIETQLGRPTAVGQPQVAPADAWRVGPDQRKPQHTGAVARTHQPMRRIGRCAHHRLAPAQHGGTGLAAQRAAHLRQIVPRLGLDRREHRSHRAVDHTAQQLARQLAWQALQQPSAQHQAGQVGLGQQGLAQRLHDQHVIGQPTAQPANGLRQRSAQQPELAGQALPQRRDRFGCAQQRFTPVEGGGRSQPACQAVTQQRLGVAEFEHRVHRRPQFASKCWAMMLRCTSLVPA